MLVAFDKLLFKQEFCDDDDDVLFRLNDSLTCTSFLQKCTCTFYNCW